MIWLRIPDNNFKGRLDTCEDCIKLWWWRGSNDDDGDDDDSNFPKGSAAFIQDSYLHLFAVPLAHFVLWTSAQTPRNKQGAGGLWKWHVAIQLERRGWSKISISWISFCPCPEKGLRLVYNYIHHCFKNQPFLSQLEKKYVLKVLKWIPQEKILYIRLHSLKKQPK